MPWTLSGTTVTATGTATLDELVAADSAFSLTTFTSEADADGTIKIVTQDSSSTFSRRLVISNNATFTIQQNEMLILGRSASDFSMLLVQNGGTLNVGTSATLNSNRDANTPSAFPALVFTDLFNNSSHFQNRGDIESGATGITNFYRNVTLKVGAVLEGEGYVTGAWDVNRASNEGTNDSSLNFLNQNIEIDGLEIYGRRALVAFTNSPTIPPKFTVFNSNAALYNRYITNDTILEVAGYSTFGSSTDLLSNDANFNNALRLLDVPIVNGTPFDYVYRREFSTTGMHRIETRKRNIIIECKDADGNLLQNVLVYVRDYNNGDRVNYTQGDTVLDYDYTQDQVYSGFTNSEGRIGFDILTRAHASNTDAIPPWDYRSINDNSDDLFGVYVHKANFGIAESTIIAAGSGLIVKEMVLLPDADFTNTESAIFNINFPVNSAEDLYDAGYIYRHCTAQFGTRFADTVGTGQQIATSTDFNNIKFTHNVSLDPPFTFNGGTMDFGQKNLVMENTTDSADTYRESQNFDGSVNFRVTTTAVDGAFDLNERTLKTGGFFFCGDTTSNTFNVVSNGSLEGASSTDLMVIENVKSYPTIQAFPELVNSFKDVAFKDVNIDEPVFGGATKFIVLDNCTAENLSITRKSGSDGSIIVQGAPGVGVSVGEGVSLLNTVSVTRNAGSTEGSSNNEGGRLSIWDLTTDTEVAFSNLGAFDALTGKFTYLFNSIDFEDLNGDNLAITFAGFGSTDARVSLTFSGQKNQIAELNNIAIATNAETIPAGITIVESGLTGIGYNSSTNKATFGISGTDNNKPGQAATNRILQQLVRGTKLYAEAIAKNSGAVNGISQEGTLYGIVDGDYFNFQTNNNVHSQVLSFIQNDSTTPATNPLSQSFVNGTETYVVNIDVTEKSGISNANLDAQTTILQKDISTNLTAIGVNLTNIRNN